MIRLIYDECNPTADRRPTTAEDVENDIHVEEFDSVDELLNKLAELANYDSIEEFAYEFDLDVADFDAVISELLSYFSDPGDGSPNILYLNIDGKVFDEAMPYDSIENLDLATADEGDIIDAIIENEGYEYEDDEDYDEDEDYDDEEDEEDESETEFEESLKENKEDWYKGIDDEGDTDFKENKVTTYSDDYINEKYENLIGKKIRIIHMDDPYASERYAGKEGVIENVATDPWGDVYYDGTWGGLSIYPNIDTIEFIDESLDEKFKVVSGTDKNLIEIAQLVEKELLKTDPKVDVRVWGDQITIMIHSDGKKIESAVKKFVEDTTKGEFSLEIKIKPNYNTYVLVCKLVKVQNQTQKNGTPKQTNTNNNQNNQQANQQEQEPQKQMLVNSLTKDDDESLIKDNVDEGLFDAKDINYGHKAWVLNQIISSMNDETAYYDTEWLYTWPDGETEQECDDDFGDKESFEDLERTFLSIYQYNDAEEGENPEDAEYNFHRDGLYNPTREAVEVAHEYDKKLGLEPIKVLGNVKEELNKDVKNRKVEEDAQSSQNTNDNQRWNEVVVDYYGCDIYQAPDGSEQYWVDCPWDEDLSRDNNIFDDLDDVKNAIYDSYEDMEKYYVPDNLTPELIKKLVANYKSYKIGHLRCYLSDESISYNATVWYRNGYPAGYWTPDWDLYDDTDYDYDLTFDDILEYADYDEDELNNIESFVLAKYKELDFKSNPDLCRAIAKLLYISKLDDDDKINYDKLNELAQDAYDSSRD